MRRETVAARAILLALGGVAFTACNGDSAAPSPALQAAASQPTGAATRSATLPAGVNTTFADRTTLRNFDYDFGFSTNMNVFVREFSGGAAAGDIDGDGDIDVFILRGDIRPNVLYRNENGVEFTSQASSAGLANTLSANMNGRHSGPTFGDLDGDGDLDLLIGGLEGDPLRLYINNGFGAFTDVTAGSGFDLAASQYTVSIAMGDYDADGDLDVAMSHWGTPRNASSPGETETLWRNDSGPSGLRFTPTSLAAGVATNLALDRSTGVLGADHDYSFSPSFADMDNDGDLDLVIVSDFRGSRIFMNQGDGTFLLNPFSPDDENGMGSAIGDYDNDGDLDWFVSSINGNRLYENLGGGSFRRAPESGVESGGWGWGSCFADFNADGWLDIYQTNGWEAGKDPSASNYVNDESRLWMNNGDGTFTDQASASNMLDTDQGRGVICDDLDNDGDVDVLLLTAEPTDSPIYWENQLTNDNFLKVTLRGAAPNTFAIGATIRMTIADAVQMRQVSINSNFTSHNSTTQVFGLGDHSTAGLRVTWPDGAETIFGSVNANQTLVIDHPAR